MVNLIRTHFGLPFKFVELDLSPLEVRGVTMTVHGAQELIDQFYQNFPEARKYMAQKKMTLKVKKAAKALNEELETKAPASEPEQDQPVSAEMATDSFTSPESSNIHGAQFFDVDPNVGREQAHMVIHFKNHSLGQDRTKVARSYIYTEPLAAEVKPIDKALWEQFKSEASKGRYFASQIRNRYKSELIWPLGK